MSQLITINEKDKGLSVPCKALPEAVLNAQIASLTSWLELLLGVKDSEDNVKRIKVLLGYIKDNAWGLSVKQIMEAFKMYVEGKLNLEVTPGFIDVSQFYKVINEYKKISDRKVDRKAFPYKINDYYNEHKKLDDKGKPIIGVVETFDYLYEVGVLPKKDASEKTIEAYEKMMISAGGYLIAPLIDERKELQEDGLQKTPRFKEIQMEIQKIRKQEHPALKPKFKQLVLESFFKKQKRHLRDIL